MFHDLFHFLGDGCEEIGCEFQFSAFANTVFIAIDFRNNTLQLKRIRLLVDFQTDDNNENNNNVTKNTGLNIYFVGYLYNRI